jgi:hypothetical protein
MIVVDRIEGEFAVVEIGGAKVDVPLADLPPGVREGDRLAFTVLPPSPDDEAAARLARLKARTPQGPGSFDL